MTKNKTNEDKLEKIPLLVIYKQGGKIIAEQPEEIINKFEFWGFLKIYCDSYQEKLKEECLGGFENE